MRLTICPEAMITIWGYTRLMSDITKLDEMVVKNNKSNKGGRYEFL